MTTTFITQVQIGNEKLDIYRTAGGGLIGLDASYLEQMDDDETLINPYDQTEMDITL